MIFYIILIFILVRGDSNLSLNGNYSATVENTTAKSFISSIYQVQIEIATSVIHENDIELARRLELVVGDALSAARAKHLRKGTMFFAERKDNEDIKVEIIKHRTAGSSTFLNFASWIEGELLLGEIIASDISLLNGSHISALLRYPFTRIISQKEVEETSSNKWWIAALIIGAGLLLLCLGWFILFLYFNTCGANKIPYEVTKTVYYKDITTQCDPQNFHSEKKQNSDLTMNMRSNDASCQLKKTPPVVHQLAEDDLNTTQQRTQSTHSKPFRPDLAPLKIVDPAMKSVPNTNDLDEEMQYISSNPNFSIQPKKLVNDPNKVDVSHTPKQQTGTQLPRATESKRAVRPLAAGKTRPVRTNEGKIISTHDRTEWSSYNAGDAISAIYSISPNVTSNHPRPGNPSEEGFVVLRERVPSDNSMSMIL